MPDINLKEISGFQVTVNSYVGSFTATKGDIKLNAKTLEELEELIKETCREERRFKPLDVIHVRNDRLGRVTSRVASSEQLVYFSFKEDGSSKATRTQESLTDYGWGDKKPLFVKATPKNLAVLKQIEEKHRQIKALDAEIYALRETYEEPVTWEVVDAQAEPKKKAKHH